jgi:serine/threonine protein kinase
LELKVKWNLRQANIISNLKGDAKTYSLCGTPGYLAPEIFQQEGHDHLADWWSLGALLYEMLNGLPPFYSHDQEIMFNKILTVPYNLINFKEFNILIELITETY